MRIGLTGGGATVDRMIEQAIDGCEDVGNTLERIVLKNG